QTTSFVLRKSDIKEYKAKFLRLVDYRSQQEKESAFLSKNNLHTVMKENFSKIPGSPIAYWVNKRVIELFSEQRSLRDYGEPRHGMSTGNNDKCLKLWFEVDIDKIAFNCGSLFEFEATNRKFIPYRKGGEFRKWYGNNDYVIAYDKPSLDYMKVLSGYRSSSVSFFFRASINWSDVSSSYFGVRYSYKGFAFDGRGSSMFCDKEYENYLLGVLASKFSKMVLDILNPTLTFNIENIASIPVIIKYTKIYTISAIVEENVQISKCEWDSFETSWDFQKQPLLNGASVKGAFENWKKEALDRFTQLKSNEEELNRIFIDIYGLQEELTPEVEEKDVTVRRADLPKDMRSFISYAVGCMFGRYSLDNEGLIYAGGQWSGSKYSTFIPDKDNILPITDEEYFADDIVGLFTTFVKTVYGVETLEDNLNFIANALGNRGNSSRETIRNYFVKDFFKDHCKVYQNRPIYWLFDSGKENGFKALIYMHRYDVNTIGNLRIDYLHKMQRIYENEISRMQDNIENSKDIREVTVATKRKEKLIKQLKETKDYDEKIAHLALARIAIDLDDGVKVNYEKIQTDAEGKKLNVLARI
ncbi:MAG: BREX-1 system adenine-specific DNA-methyltransferase PglX, partial [bacterium]|nr:BREX-1 system adenine-specific DNA-methyltransferase PglX [bacterium]